MFVVEVPLSMPKIHVKIFDLSGPIAGIRLPFNAAADRPARLVLSLLKADDMVRDAAAGKAG